MLPDQLSSSPPFTGFAPEVQLLLFGWWRTSCISRDSKCFFKFAVVFFKLDNPAQQTFILFSLADTNPKLWLYFQLENVHLFPPSIVVYVCAWYGSHVSCPHAENMTCRVRANIFLLRKMTKSVTHNDLDYWFGNSNASDYSLNSETVVRVRCYSNMLTCVSCRPGISLTW